MTPHPQADLPAIQRYKIGYHSDDWGQRSSTPSGIPDASGSWVRYADHVAALVDGQAVAPAQPDLGTLNGLAKQYADSYASPHHFTLGVNGLRQIIQRALPQAAQQAPAGAWIERWYGSGGKEGYEGWSIVSKEGRSLVAYLGRGVEPDAVTEIVMAHNAAPAAPSTPTSGGWISVERHSDQSVLVVFPSCRLASEFERSLLPASPTIGGESNG